LPALDAIIKNRAKALGLKTGKMYITKKRRTKINRKFIRELHKNPDKIVFSKRHQYFYKNKSYLIRLYANITSYKSMNPEIKGIPRLENLKRFDDSQVYEVNYNGTSGLATQKYFSTTYFKTAAEADSMLDDFIISLKKKYGIDDVIISKLKYILKRFIV